VCEVLVLRLVWLGIRIVRCALASPALLFALCRILLGGALKS